jgi:G-patch domain
MKDDDKEQCQDKHAGASTNPAPMATAGADNRNMAWRKSNVGSKLLAKMGWSDGQAVGKRQRRATVLVSDTNNSKEAPSATAVQNSETTTCSGEGLRVMKRQDGLGIGATAASSAYSNASNAVQHVQDYVNVLALLQQPPKKEEKTDKKKKKKEKKKRKRHHEEESMAKVEPARATKTKLLSTTTTTSMSSNSTMTNPKIRKAKFQQKTSDDYKGIFGSFHSDDIIKSTIK